MTKSDLTYQNSLVLSFSKRGRSFFSRNVKSLLRDVRSIIVTVSEYIKILFYDFGKTFVVEFFDGFCKRVKKYYRVILLKK